MMKVASILESQKFKVAVMIINIFLIVGLVVYIIFRYTGGFSGTTGDAPQVESKTYTEEEITAAMDRAGENMVSIYGNLLPGSKAEFSDGNVMNFNAEGVFSGFFDAENPSIEGTYVVTASDDDYLADVNIYKNDSSDYVQYKLMYDEKKDFMLYYPANNAYVTLTY